MKKYFIFLAIATYVLMSAGNALAWDDWLYLNYYDMPGANYVQYDVFYGPPPADTQVYSEVTSRSSATTYARAYCADATDYNPSIWVEAVGGSGSQVFNNYGYDWFTGAVYCYVEINIDDDDSFVGAYAVAGVDWF